MNLGKGDCRENEARALAGLPGGREGRGGAGRGGTRVVAPVIRALISLRARLGKAVTDHITQVMVPQMVREIFNQGSFSGRGGGGFYKDGSNVPKQVLRDQRFMGRL